MLQSNNTGVCSQRLSHAGLPLHTAHTTQALRCSAGNRLRPALGYMHLPRSKQLRLGSQVALRGTDLLGPAFCALPRTE